MPLTETTLAKRLGVSRTPIREALRMLEQDGLVERANRGLRVRERSPSEIFEIYEARAALEAMAARSAAERHTDVDRVQLQARLHAMRQALNEPASKQAMLSREFHRTIWHASHNQTLIDLLERLHVHLFRYPTTTHVVEGRAEASYSEHEAIVDAILARDALKAAALAEEHMVNARNTKLKMLEDHPEVFGVTEYS